MEIKELRLSQAAIDKAVADYRKGVHQKLPVSHFCPIYNALRENGIKTEGVGLSIAWTSVENGNKRIQLGSVAQYIVALPMDHWEYLNPTEFTITIL